MNFTTHVTFGMLVGALFFGKLDLILLIAIGSAIPDMDREYGFFSKDYFRYHHIHRALCHNFLFLGILYLVNPFIALGAFLHTLLDALTTTKDRGVEWLYPFSRLVKRSIYDHTGKRKELDPKTRIYMYQDDPVELTRKTNVDLRDYTPRPWRRSYGPAVSGGILDVGIFVGSTTLLALLVLISVYGGVRVIDFSSPLVVDNETISLLVGSLGIFLVLSIGELSRLSEAKKVSRTPPFLWQASFLLSLSLIALGIILGAYFNPGLLGAFERNLPYVGAGALTVFLVAFLLLKIYSMKSLARMRKGDHPKAV
jgi:hypothetical protein